MHPYRTVGNCSFSDIQVFCSPQMDQWLRQPLSFRSHITDIPSIVLTFVKTTKEFALQTPRVHLIDFLNEPRPAQP
jgi:hypothetical protein